MYHTIVQEKVASVKVARHNVGGSLHMKAGTSGIALSVECGGRLLKVWPDNLDRELAGSW